MSSQINWEAAQAREAELRRLEASTDAHPFSRLAFLLSEPRRRHRR
jgi:hypothetical protein